MDSTMMKRGIEQYEFVDKDQNRHLYIEGDNLEGLQRLRKDYEGRVKLIYIDPPYNTGNEYVYHDNYHDAWGEMMRATLEDGSIRMKTAKTLWYKPEYDTGSAARVLKRLFGRADIFDNPKSLVLMKDIVRVGAEKDAIILDFFSGSATTAHAVIELNDEDGGHRSFIMIQQPEPCKEDGEAYKAGYKTICEIGKERIRRVMEDER